MKNVITALFITAPLLVISQLINFSTNQVDDKDLDLHREGIQVIYKDVSAFDVLEVDYQLLRNKVKSASDIIELNLEIAAKEFEIEMMENDLKSSPDFKTVVPQESGEHLILPKGEVYWYKGFLANNPNSSVRFSIKDDIFFGLINDGKDRYFIEPASRYNKDLPADWVIFYNIEDVIEKEEHVCGTDHTHRIEEAGDNHNETSPKNTEPCVTARIALAADGAMVDKLGSVQNVENEMLNIFNVVEDRYKSPDINIEYEIATIFISPSVAQDPWNNSSGDFGDYLDAFTNWGNNNGFGTTNFALASLWTNKSFPNGNTSGAVGLAWVGTVCTNARYNTNIHFTPNATQLIQVQTHEMGHNWSAGHAPDNNSPNNIYIMAPSVGSLNDQWHPNTINSITSHKATRNCIAPSCDNPPIAAFASNSTGFSCTGIIDFTDQSQNSPDTWLWDFGDGNTSTAQNPSHAYTQNGTYTVTLTTTNQFGTDVATQNNLIQVQLLDPPTVEGDERCGPGSVNLSASGGDHLVWYDSPTSNNELNVGNSFSQNLNQTTTFWVANQTPIQEEYVGPVDNSIGAGAYFDNNDNWGLEFNAINDFVLKSVKVFSNQATTRLIEVLDNNENVIVSATPFIPAGESRVALNFEIPQGNGYLIKLTSNNPPANLSLYRTGGGANYPYTAPGLVSITGNNTTTGTADDFYYYFFDWEVHEPSCASARVPVLANLNACLNTDIFEKENAINVYPNPSSGIFTIDLSENIAIRGAYVVNSLGQKVTDLTLEGANGSSELNLSHVSDGVYTLFLIDESQVVYQKKLIKK